MKEEERRPAEELVVAEGCAGGPRGAGGGQELRRVKGGGLREAKGCVGQEGGLTGASGGRRMQRIKGGGSRGAAGGRRMNRAKGGGCAGQEETLDVPVKEKP